MIDKSNPSEIMNTLGFRAIKGVIKKKYPFIKDVILNERYRKYDTTLFLKGLVDPIELEKYVGEGKLNYDFMALTFINKTVFDYPGLLGYFKDVDEARPLMNSINEMAKKAHRSTVVPEEEKVPWWTIDIGDFFTPLPLMEKYIRQEYERRRQSRQ